MQGGEHGEGSKLCYSESNSGKHGNTSVLDFCFLEPLDVEGIGEAEGVESYGADESVGVGGVEEEGHGFGHFSVEGGGCLLILALRVYVFSNLLMNKKTERNIGVSKLRKAGKSDEW